MDEKVYNGLHKTIGRGHISRFIEELVRPHVFNQHLHAAYKQMAQDEIRETEALEWSESMIGGVSDETK